jgi:hypothetical protein
VAERLWRGLHITHGIVCCLQNSNWVGAIAALRAHDWMRIIRYVRGIRVPKVGRTGRNDLKNGNSPKLR